LAALVVVVLLELVELVVLVELDLVEPAVVDGLFFGFAIILLFLNTVI
jgi:hypothetical protein